jgi:ADP-heptose:LPS heptosyltransferase
LASTSPEALAAGVLAQCLDGAKPDFAAVSRLAAAALDPDEFVASAASRALFTGLVEPLADRFELRLCDLYARIFARVLAHALPEFTPVGLLNRYRAVRRVRPVKFEPSTVFVLSRVTLGADVAVTSIVLDAARRRFPRARILLAGPRKAWDLFEGDTRLEFLPIPYGRTATLADRLSVWPQIRTLLSEPGSIVLDPDSRLSQLGLLPVCEASRHFVYESRSYGKDWADPLPSLTSLWVAETLGVNDAAPFLAPKLDLRYGDQRVVTASFGVGENPAKRLPDPFEAEVLKLLCSLGLPVIVDLGAGGEEGARVRRAIEDSGLDPGRVTVHEGSFASFAALIAHSDLYFGYDSAGQHAAAALGVPLISVFAGEACDRMFQRWRPDGPGPKTVIRASGMTPEQALVEVRAALAR